MGRATAISTGLLLLAACAPGWSEGDAVPPVTSPPGGDDGAVSGLRTAVAPFDPPELADDDSAPDPGLPGWIGSPCEADTDCPYDGAVCLTDGFPSGMCTQACDLYCPDEDGYPVTFCVDGGWLPASAAALGDGACHSRCDFELYPPTGCRDGYGCAHVSRANEPGTEGWACLAGRASELPACYQELADRGLAFEPTFVADGHPSDHPELTCHLQDPLYLIPPVLGIEIRYISHSEPDRVLVDCDTAHAIADTALDVAPEGVTELIHIGTYNCRTISGTSTLSQHALGRAIDIGGFTFEDGTTVTVYDHWEDGDAAPDTDEGLFLYDAVHRWYDDWIWNIILTPEYNDDHDDHFHVDMSEGSHTLHFTSERYLGPAPYDD